ncbi:MAG: hypothetical protein HN391_05885, partial [Anaerolineae bacterium]|nr:hypothetical protein [Anaerolineae bacterium]
MSRKLLSAVEIGELIQVLRQFFKYHKDLQENNDVASFIQRPKIPPFLSEALIVDLGNRGLLNNLECSDFSLSTAKGDVVAISKKQLVVWQTRIDGYRKIWHPC